MSDEIALSFGTEGNLVGVLTQPLTWGPQRLCCLILNVGVTHHVGPNRTSVRLARALACAGIASLRFDLSGVGDSVATNTTLDFREQAVEDMRAALDVAERATGARRFLVFGICSGAQNALALSLRDTRVVGLAMFDGHRFRARHVQLQRKLRRLLAFPFNAGVRYSSRAWKELTAWTKTPFDGAAWARAAAWLRNRRAPQGQNIFSEGARPYGSADFEADMERLLARGTAIYIGFSASADVVDRGRDQLSALASAPFLSRVEYAFMPDVDHTAVTRTSQHKLCEAICAWAERAEAALGPAGSRSDEFARTRTAPTAEATSPASLARAAVGY